MSCGNKRRNVKYKYQYCHTLLFLIDIHDPRGGGEFPTLKPPLKYDTCTITNFNLSNLYIFLSNKLNENKI